MSTTREIICPKCSSNRDEEVIMEFEEAAWYGSDRSTTVAVCPKCDHQIDDWAHEDNDDHEKWEI